MKEYTLKQVKLPSAKEQVANILRDAILSKEFKQGDALNITELAAKLGVSAMPVREAFYTLERDGLIELKPHKTAIVLGADARYIREYYGIRSLLEGEAALLASREGDGKETLRTALKEAAEAYAAKDMESFSSRNRAIHAAIWEAADNRRLKQLLDDLWMSKAIMQTGYTAKDMARSQQQHIEIVQCILKNQGEEAKQKMEEHLRFGMEVVLRKFGA